MHDRQQSPEATVSLKRGIFYTSLTQVPTLLLYFVASTLMTRALGDEGRGAYALFQNQVAMVTMVLGFSLSFGTTYFTARDKGDPARMVKICTSLLLVNMVLVPLFFLVVFTNSGVHRVFLPAGATHRGYLLYLILIVLLSQYNSFIRAILLGLKKFRLMNQMSIFVAALSAIGFTGLYLIRDRMDPGMILPAVLGLTLSYTFINAAIWTIAYIRNIGIRPAPIWDWKAIQPVMSFVIVAYLMNFINMINYRFDIWVVGYYSGTAQLGLYAVAVGLGQLLFYIPDPFSQVIQPYLYAEMRPDLLAKVKFIMRLNFTTVLLLSVLLGIAAPWIVPLLFGEAFQGSVVALWWLLPGIVLVSGSKLIGPLVVQGELIRFNLYALIVALTLTIVLDFLLVPHFGIAGASLASSISYGSNLAMQCLVVKRRMKIPIGDMFILQPDDVGRLRDLVQRRLGHAGRTIGG